VDLVTTTTTKSAQSHAYKTSRKTKEKQMLNKESFEITQFKIKIFIFCLNFKGPPFPNRLS
jgi:hypothetical protein